MSKINVKKSLLEVVEDYNLEILKIDLMNDEESSARFYGEERDVFSCKVYTTLEDLDFELESFLIQEEVQGTVYCRDKIMDEDGRVGWISKIVPYRSPSESFMKATLSLTLFFHMEKKDGTRDTHEVYVHGLPIKL